MAGKFELKKAKNGQFFFSLKASNGQIILGSEMYKDKRSAIGGIESVQKNCAIGERFERKTSAKGEAFFVLKSGNHQQVGRSETYSSSAAMEKGIESVKKTAPGAPIDDQTA